MNKLNSDCTELILSHFSLKDYHSIGLTRKKSKFSCLAREQIYLVKPMFQDVRHTCLYLLSDHKIVKFPSQYHPLLDIVNTCCIISLPFKKQNKLYECTLKLELDHVKEYHEINNDQKIRGCKSFLILEHLSKEKEGIYRRFFKEYSFTINNDTGLSKLDKSTLKHTFRLLDSNTHDLDKYECLPNCSFITKKTNIAYKTNSEIALMHNEFTKKFGGEPRQDKLLKILKSTNNRFVKYNPEPKLIYSMLDSSWDITNNNDNDRYFNNKNRSVLTWEHESCSSISLSLD